jgi:hypothetical protein
LETSESSRLGWTNVRIKKPCAKPRKYGIQVDCTNTKNEEQYDEQEFQEDMHEEMQDMQEVREVREVQEVDFFNLYVANDSLGISLESALSISIDAMKTNFRHF